MFFPALGWTYLSHIIETQFFPTGLWSLEWLWVLTTSNWICAVLDIRGEVWYTIILAAISTFLSCPVGRFHKRSTYKHVGWKLLYLGIIRFGPPTLGNLVHFLLRIDNLTLSPFSVTFCSSSVEYSPTLQKNIYLHIFLVSLWNILSSGKFCGMTELIGLPISKAEVHSSIFTLANSFID